MSATTTLITTSYAVNDKNNYFKIHCFRTFALAVKPYSRYDHGIHIFKIDIQRCAYAINNYK